MAVPVKDGKVWRHRVMINGRRVSGTFDTKGAALAWEAEQRTMRPGGNATTQTCRDAFERYEREVSKAKKGYRWESLRLAAFGRSALADVLVSEVSAVHVAAWRDERLKKVQGATVQREMNLMSNVFAIARKEWKWIEASPTTDVRRPKDNKPRYRRISDDEIERILHALNWREAAPTTKQQSIAAAFLFALETAMRAGEICKLRRENVKGRVAEVRDTKNGDDRDVPLSARALAIWKLVPDGFGITTASMDSMFRTAVRRAAIDDLHFHDTRHEAITRLATKLHVLELARMTGHRDIRKLMIYFNPAAEDIADKL